MNKKLIRLTEGDLHRIVKESVNKVLTELDWRTMASASKKARQRGDDRSEYFAKGATDAFNKNHSFNKIEDEGDGYRDRRKATLKYDIKPNGYDEHYTHSTLDTPPYKAPALNYKMDSSYRFTDDGDIDLTAPFEDDFRFSGSRVHGMPNYTPNFDDNKIRNKNDRELNNFYSNKAVYKQGKGWRQK